MTPFIQGLPEGLTEDSVIRIGVLEAPISLHIRHGLVEEREGKFFRLPGPFPVSSTPAPTPDPRPICLATLEEKSFKVIPGKKPKDDRVCLGSNVYINIQQAIRTGLLTDQSTPPNY